MAEPQPQTQSQRALSEPMAAARSFAHSDGGRLVQASRRGLHLPGAHPQPEAAQAALIHQLDWLPQQTPPKIYKTDPKNNQTT